MTPLVAGIALTGKAPVYENVYMSGLKQKAAGEAAKAKEKAKVAEDIEKSINVDPSKYHYSMQNLVKEKSAEAVTKMRDAIAEDNVRGINKANDIKRDLLIDLAGMANASSQLFEREKPTYTSTYIRPEVTFSKLNSMDIREAAKDPEVAQELADYGWQINVDDKGRVSINFSDIKSFDVRKDYNTFQGDIIDQFAPELAEKFKAGSTTRQELSQVITKDRSDAYLDLISSDPIGGRSAVFNWKKKYNIDITTPEGKQKVYDTFVAPERSGFTSRPPTSINLGGGGTIAGDPTVSPIESNADASFGWSVEPKRDAAGNAIPGRFKLSKDGMFATDEKGQPKEFASVTDAENWKKENATKTISGEALQVGYEASALTPVGAFYVGERTSRTKFGAKVEGNTINAKVNRLETVPVYTGDAPMQFGMFVLKKGVAIPSDILAANPNIQNEKRLFIVAEGGRVVGSDGKETTTGATIYVPANKANLGAVLKGIPPGDKGLRAKIEALIKGTQKLGGAGPIGAAEKQTGAKAPQSTFNLLDIPTA